MNNLTMNFVNESNASDVYTLQCQNNSQEPWVFYTYQKPENQQKGVESLAWLVTPYKIVPGNKIIFQWTADYFFCWGTTAEVFYPKQTKPCFLVGLNQTTFSIEHGVPDLSDPVSGGPRGSLSIEVSPNITEGYNAGIGMYGKTIYIQEAMPNTSQVYTPNQSQCFIAAGSQMLSGQVLPASIPQSAEVIFPTGVYTMYATFQNNGRWEISQLIGKEEEKQSV